jgi:hypothetical protein
VFDIEEEELVGEGHFCELGGHVKTKVGEVGDDCYLFEVDGLAGAVGSREQHHSVAVVAVD